MSADISFLCWCWSFQKPSRSQYASYSISTVGCCSECYPSKPISTWSTSTYRRSRSLSLSLLPYPPIISHYFSLMHKQTQNKHVYTDYSNMVWFVQLSWGFRIYPNLTMGNVWTCRLVTWQCSGPVEWLPLKPSSAAVSNMFDSVLFASSWNRSAGLICVFF